MNSTTLLRTAIIFAVFSGGLVTAAIPDKTQFAKYDLTKEDWELIEDSKISGEKLAALLDSGIRPQEYFAYPWLHLGISEHEWVRQRAAGLIKKNVDTDRGATSKEWAVVQSLVLPGFHQFKRKELVRGTLMSGIATASLALFVFQHNPANTHFWGFDYPEYLALLAGDMIWSGVDFNFQLSREINPDAQRFSFDACGQTLDLCDLAPLNTRKNIYAQNVSQQ